MIKYIKQGLRRFNREEDGLVSAEFMLVFPLFMALMVMSLELSMITLRHSMLERGLDMAVRDIRLGTGTDPSHDAIKERICEEAYVISDCTENLRLQMIPTDMRNLTTLGDELECTDKAEEGVQVLDFTPGQQNQLMFLRACAKYDPIFPTWQLARALSKDTSGQVKIVAMSAFVQEPL
ncbi:pilus assembly protein [Rhodobacteraceae bacterium KMM 6894]|nr:pilus assembly protein [Rhodobacteraceae bacterium KMM 6894]